MVKRFTLIHLDEHIVYIYDNRTFIASALAGAELLVEVLNQLEEENEQLKIALKDKENLIKICEKKFKELGYLISCDDDGYVIE